MNDDYMHVSIHEKKTISRCIDIYIGLGTEGYIHCRDTCLPPFRFRGPMPTGGLYMYVHVVISVSQPGNESGPPPVKKLKQRILHFH